MAKSHSNSQIAKRYATALFRLAGGNAAKLLPEIAKLKEICALEDVKQFFHNPLLSKNVQADIVRNILEKQGFSTLLVDAAVRVALNRRLPLLADILDQFRAMVMQAMNEMEVDIVSAKSLNAADVEALAKHLSNIYGKTVHARAKTDPSLIGGIMLNMQGSLIDYSVAGKLQRLAHHLKTTNLQETPQHARG